MSEWIDCYLEDIVSIHDSKRIPLNAEERSKRPGLYPYYGANGQVDTIDDYLYEGDYILIAEDGGYFHDMYRDVAYIASGRFWVNNHAHVVRVNDDMNVEYVCHFLNSIDWTPYVGGTTRLKLTQGSMRRIKVRCPDLLCQNEIVSEVNSLFSKIESMKDAVNHSGFLLSQLRQSILASAFRGDLTASWREENPDVEPASELLARIRVERKKLWIEDYAQKLADRARTSAQKKNKPFTDENWQSYYEKKIKAGEKKYEEPEPVDAEAEGLPDIPEGWEWIRLGALSTGKQYDVSDGPFGSKLKTVHYVEESKGAAQVVTLGNLGANFFKDDNRYFVTEEKYESLEKHWINEGDLLIAGMAEPVGRCCQAPSHILPALVKADCFKFSPSQYIESLWIMYYLNSPLGLIQCLRISQGTGRSRINLTNTKKIPIPIPSLTEQMRICGMIDDNFESIRAQLLSINDMFQEIESLRKSILHQAFNPPTDEATP